MFTAAAIFNHNLSPVKGFPSKLKSFSDYTVNAVVNFQRTRLTSPIFSHAISLTMEKQIPILQQVKPNEYFMRKEGRHAYMREAEKVKK
jgi:hypothetical protein